MLPTTVLQTILLYLFDDELLPLSLTTRQFNQTINHPSFWRDRSLILLPGDTPSVELTTKEHYHCLKRAFRVIRKTKYLYLDEPDERCSTYQENPIHGGLFKPIDSMDYPIELQTRYWDVYYRGDYEWMYPDNPYPIYKYSRSVGKQLIYPDRGNEDSSDGDLGYSDALINYQAAPDISILRDVEGIPLQKGQVVSVTRLRGHTIDESLKLGSYKVVPLEDHLTELRKLGYLQGTWFGFYEHIIGVTPDGLQSRHSSPQLPNFQELGLISFVR